MAEKKPTKAELAKREREFKLSQKRLADRFDIDSQNAALDAEGAWRRLQQTRTPTAATPRPSSTMQSLYNMFGIRQAPPRVPATPAPTPPVRTVPDEVLRNRALLEQQSQLPAGTRGRDLRLSPTALNTAPITPRPLSSILPRQTIEQASQYADPDVLRRMAAQQAAARSGRAGPVRPPNTPLEAFQRNPAGRTPSRGFRTTTPRTPLIEGPFRPPANILGRSLRALGGGVLGGAELLMDPTVADAPTDYDIEAQHAFGMPMEDFYAQMTPEQDFIPGLAMIPDDINFDSEQIAAMDAPDINPILAAALGMRGMDVDLSGAFEPGMAEDIPLAEQFTPGAGLSPYEFGQDYLNPAGMSAYEFGQEYLNPLLTSAPTGYSYLQNTLGRGIADLMRGAAGYEQLPEEQELIEAVDRPDLAPQLAEFNTPQNLEAIPDPMDDYGVISPDDLREQVMLEYMQGQQQADPRQRQIMGSADEFAANRPPPRMSPQQLDEYMRMIARDESINAGLAGDPFAGYDESLFPEGSQVFVDPVTGATSFEGNQDYIPDAALTGRQSMDDLRLGTEYTSRALRNLGRARGVPSPQEVERSRLLSTLGGDAQGQGYRADQIAEQMDRIRSRLNSATLTPLELDAGRAQLEALDSERAGALTAQDRARALQLRGIQAEPLTAPEDVVLEQLQEAETARAQAEAAAEQRRALEELRNTGRNQVGARDIAAFDEFFASRFPSNVMEGQALNTLTPEQRVFEQQQLTKRGLAASLAASRPEFRTQPAIAASFADMLAIFPPEEQARALAWLQQEPDIASALERTLQTARKYGYEDGS